MNDEDFKKLVLEKLDSIENRFDDIDKRFDKIDNRIADLKLVTAINCYEITLLKIQKIKKNNPELYNSITKEFNKKINLKDEKYYCSAEEEKEIVDSLNNMSDEDKEVEESIYFSELTDDDLNNAIKKDPGMKEQINNIRSGIYTFNYFKNNIDMCVKYMDKYNKEILIKSDDNKNIVLMPENAYIDMINIIDKCKE